MERADLLVAELQTLGVDPEDIQKFMLNAPGQHDRLPDRRGRGCGSDGARRRNRRGDRAPRWAAPPALRWEPPPFPSWDLPRRSRAWPSAPIPARSRARSTSWASMRIEEQRADDPPSRRRARRRTGADAWTEGAGVRCAAEASRAVGRGSRGHVARRRLGRLRSSERSALGGSSAALRPRAFVSRSDDLAAPPKRRVAEFNSASFLSMSIGMTARCFVVPFLRSRRTLHIHRSLLRVGARSRQLSHCLAEESRMARRLQ